MLTLTSPVETPMHRLPAGAKLAALALFTALLFWLQSPLWLLGAALAVAALHMTAGPRFARHAARMLRPIWPFVVVVALWHGWTGDYSAGSAIVLRMITAVAAANLVTMTTRLADMISVVETAARPLAPLLPPKVLALSIALVIRFVPVLSERTAQLADAYRARSTGRARWHIIAPAAIAALDDAEHVAEALRARGGVS